MGDSDCSVNVGYVLPHFHVSSSVSGIRDQGSGINDQESGISDQRAMRWCQNPCLTCTTCQGGGSSILNPFNGLIADTIKSLIRSQACPAIENAVREPSSTCLYTTVLDDDTRVL